MPPHPQKPAGHTPASYIYFGFAALGAAVDTGAFAGAGMGGRANIDGAGAPGGVAVDLAPASAAEAGFKERNCRVASPTTILS